MAYSDFTLKKIKSELNIKIVEKNSVFSHIKSVEISSYLKNTLKRNIPLALAINTEKARSEMIIINILSIYRKGAKDAKKTTLLWRLISLNIFFAPLR